MAFLQPIPIAIDSVTSCRVCLLRWAEWTALSGFMLFLVELIDVTSWEIAARRAVLQCVCCGTGMALPLVEHRALWWGLMTVAMVIYTATCVRLVDKHRKYRRSTAATAAAVTKAAPHHGPLAKAAAEVKWTREDELRGTFHLHLWCCIVWTAMVANYFFSWFLRSDTFAAMVGYPRCAAGGAAAGDADWRVTWPLVTNGVLDVISKVFFGKIIVEAYSPLFDPLQQQVKVLNEVVSHIASSMGVIWSSSKDALLVETRYGDGDEAGAATAAGGGGGGGALLSAPPASFKASPSIAPMLGLPGSLELEPEALSRLGAELVKNHPELQRLVDKAWEEHRTLDARIETNVHLSHATGGKALECEATVAKFRFGANRAVVVVLRDISAEAESRDLRREIFKKEERFKQAVADKEKQFRKEREQDAEWVATLLAQKERDLISHASASDPGASAVSSAAAAAADKEKDV